MEKNKTIQLIGFLLSVIIATASITFKVVGLRYEKTAEVQEEQIELLKLQNEGLKTKIEELTKENENLKKPKSDKSGSEDSERNRESPPPPPGNCIDELKIFVRDAQTNAPVKRAYIYNGGGRGFQAGYTDYEGKLTIYFDNPGKVGYSLIFVNKNGYLTSDTKIETCNNPDESTIISLKQKLN